MKNRIGSTAARGIVLAFGIIASTLPLAAGSGGSVYSRFGIGDLRVASSTRLFGMGGTGAAYRPAGSINEINPASWSDISSVRFSATALYEGFRTDDGAASAYLAGMFLNGLSLAIPVDSALGMTFGAGIAPYSRINYHVTGPVSQAGFDYVLTHIGEGGISRAFAGMSVSIVRGLSAGAEFNYYFGSSRYILKQTFGGTTYVGTELTRTENVRGAGSTFGLLYDDLGGLLGLEDGSTAALGLSVSTAAWPSVSSERIYHYSAASSTNPLDTIDGGERSFRIPFSMTGGVSYRSGAVIAAADVRYQDWHGTAFEQTGAARLKRSLRFSAGLELFRAAGPNVNPARTTSYQFGLYHDAGYLEIAGEPIRENGVTAGIAFPILGETRLSLAAGFAMRGSTDKILQDDKIFRISASMDITELWFQRPPEE